MTCLEKLRQDYPENTPEVGAMASNGCPGHYGYLPVPDYCRYGPKTPTFTMCKECWDREIPEEKGKEITDACFAEDGYSPKLGPEFWDEEKQEIVTEPTIKDSGDRTEFETGAVRDMREGKGRCDLMPLDVIGIIYATFCDEEESSNIPRVFFELNDFKKTGDPNYLIRALNQSGVFGESCSTMFLEVAKHFEDGAKKYGENNWQKGIPVNYYIDSAIRHYLKWLREDTDEPHDRAFVWNIMCAIWTCRNMPGLNSYTKEE